MVSTSIITKFNVFCSLLLPCARGAASFPDVSLAAKGVGAQGMKGRGKDARRLADFVFKMAECSMADDYAIFKKEHRPVCFTDFEGKVVFPHPGFANDLYALSMPKNYRRNPPLIC